MTKETIITKLEKGRAEFAYRCVEDSLINLKPFELNSKRFLEGAVKEIKESVLDKMEKQIKEKIEQLLRLLQNIFKKRNSQNYLRRKKR